MNALDSQGSHAASRALNAVTELKEDKTSADILYACALLAENPTCSSAVCSNAVLEAMPEAMKIDGRADTALMSFVGHYVWMPPKSEMRRKLARSYDNYRKSIGSCDSIMSVGRVNLLRLSAARRSIVKEACEKAHHVSSPAIAAMVRIKGAPLYASQAWAWPSQVYNKLCSIALSFDFFAKPVYLPVISSFRSMAELFIWPTVYSLLLAVFLGGATEVGFPSMSGTLFWAMRLVAHGLWKVAAFFIYPLGVKAVLLCIALYIVYKSFMLVVEPASLNRTDEQSAEALYKLMEKHLEKAPASEGDVSSATSATSRAPSSTRSQSAASAQQAGPRLRINPIVSDGARLAAARAANPAPRLSAAAPQQRPVVQAPENVAAPARQAPAMEPVIQENVDAPGVAGPALDVAVVQGQPLGHSPVGDVGAGTGIVPPSSDWDSSVAALAGDWLNVGSGTRDLWGDRDDEEELQAPVGASDTAPVAAPEDASANAAIPTAPAVNPHSKGQAKKKKKGKR